MLNLKSFLKKIIWFFAVFSAVMLIIMTAVIIALELTLPNVDKLKDVHLQAPLRILTADNKLMAEFGNVRRIPVTIDQVPQPLIEATLATEDKRFFTHSGIDILGLARAGVILFATGRKEQGGSTITMQVARNFFLTRKKTYIRKLREILLALKIDREFSKQKILELYFNKNFYGSRAYGIAAAAQIYYGETLSQLTLPQMAMIAGLPKAPSTLNPIAHPAVAKDRRDHVLFRMYELHYIDKNTLNEAINTPVTAKYHGLAVSVKAPYVAEMVRQLMVDQFGESAYDQGYTVYTTIDSRLQKAANHAVTDGLLAYDRRHGYRGAENHVDLSEANLNAAANLLKNSPAINHLIPAVVLSVDNQSVKALTKDNKDISISWQGLSWARRQVFLKNGSEKISSYPKQASDILKPGDIIRVIKMKNGSWMLSQIPIAEAALVALNPHDGSIAALTGGFNYFKSKYNRITQSSRQPGSAFKPFIYSAALDKGFTLASIINDAPIAIPDSGENTLWRPENDTKKFYGPTRLRVALAHSRNVVSIRLLQIMGIPYAVHYASRFGFDEKTLPHTLSLALGTMSLSPLKLSTGYLVFANGGYALNPYYMSQIKQNHTKIIFQANPLFAGDPVNTLTQNESTPNQAPRVITPQNAYLMTTAMQDVINSGTGRPARILHRHDLAGKTGTTNDQKDAWFCGFNSHLMATAWLGFDQPQSLHEYAIKSVLPIWIDFMREALKDQPEASMPQPADIIVARINKKTGLLASPNDPDAMFESFRKQYAPTRIDTKMSAASSDQEASLSQLY